MRTALMVAGALLAVSIGSAPLGTAGPATCDDAFCVPGIAGGVVIGAWCPDPTNYVFGTTSRGRLVFCGSPRRYQPRYFRSPPMDGIKDENASCIGSENDVAQSPTGLFLTCSGHDGQSLWLRGDV